MGSARGGSSTRRRSSIRRTRMPSSLLVLVPLLLMAALHLVTIARAFLVPPPPSQGRCWASPTAPSRMSHSTTAAAAASTSLLRQRGFVAATASVDSDNSPSSTSTLAELAESRRGLSQRFVFFGGKGGVGKTSTSTAMAVHLADQGLRTLVISTDPAHSLGDLLEQKVSGGEPVRVLGCDNLWAMEVDTAKALDRFRALFREMDVGALAAQFGVSEDLLAGLGLEDFVAILNNPPPGIDELIALAEVVRLSKEGGGGDGSNMPVAFDRVVIDTAPTGHTLRLLSFPDFLDGFLGKLVKLQLRVSKLLASISGVFGGGADERLKAADSAFAKIETAKQQMVELNSLFRDQDATEFCIVTIATQLAVAESKRLLAALRKEGIAVRHLVVNKLVQAEDQTQHMVRITKGQQHALDRLQKGVVARHGLSAVQVPYLNVEVRGVYGLKFLGDTAFGHGPAFADLFERGGPIATRFVLFGGKGGVGKTSSSAALAVKLADEGFTTAVVSTDPAHSLGDALDLDLSSGKVTEVPGLPPTATGRLFALEVDTAEAVAEFKEVLRGLGGKGKKKGGGGGIMGQLELGEFADVLESAPPGTDELVALARVLKLLKEGAPETGARFDRIVIDTAPTGHTLRLLSFPEFLEGFLERVMAIRERLKGANTLMSMFSGSGGGGEGEEGEAEGPEADGRDRLREFQLKMIELDDLLHDPARAEFVGVTIPTEMAVAETERLVAALKEQDVAIRRLVVNQVVAPQSGQGYWDRLRAGQQAALADVSRAAREAGVAVTELPYFDTEMRTVYALRVLADALTKPAAPAAAKGVRSSKPPAAAAATPAP